MKKLLVLVSLLFASPALANVPCSLPFNLTNGTIADATQVMANYNAIVACLGNAAAAGNNSDITALLGLTTPLAPSEGGTSTFLGGTGSGTNAQVVATTSPSVFTLTSGYAVVYIAGGTNTGATTLAVNAVGAQNFYRQTPSGPQPMTGGEIQSGQLVVARWDGTQYELMNTSGQFGGFGPLTNLASATTTSLGTIASHNVNITGNTTITSFGAAASTTYPVYKLIFASGLTITYNQTSCSTTGNCINTQTAGNIITVAGDTAEAVYLGSGSGGGGNWSVINYSRANGTPLVNPVPLCGANNLKIVNDASTPNTSIDITADSVVMINPTGNVPIYATAVSVVINDTVNGANGLDTGSLGGNNWYNHFLISNGTTVAGLDSLSATSPAMPAGYTYLCRFGAGITNGSANFLRVTQLGRFAQYLVGTNPAVIPNIANGTAGSFSLTSPTLTTASISGFVPPTAAKISIAVSNAYKAAGTANVIVAPNVSWGGSNNGPTGSGGAVYPVFLNSATANSVAAEIVLEGTTIAWSSNANGGAISALGWTDRVNAN